MHFCCSPLSGDTTNHASGLALTMPLPTAPRRPPQKLVRQMGGGIWSVGTFEPARVGSSYTHVLAGWPGKGYGRPVAEVWPPSTGRVVLVMASPLRRAASQALRPHCHVFYPFCASPPQARRSRRPAPAPGTALRGTGCERWSPAATC